MAWLGIALGGLMILAWIGLMLVTGWLMLNG